MNVNFNEPAGLYIHIPFCLRKCPYCDFYSITDLSLKGTFLETLEREIGMIDVGMLKFDSLYFGGGTPSILNLPEIRRLVNTVLNTFEFLPDVEITLEINPGTSDPEMLAGYRQSGINRLNIGVQSFQDKNLRPLGRIHSGNDALLAIKWARQAGFHNIGLDMIYGLPGQDRKNWLRDLTQAVKIEPEHLACYILTCESGTPLELDVKAGMIRLASEEIIRDLFDTTIDFLTNRGYLHYEISNFAGMTADGHDIAMSRHNSKYWSSAPYIGLGPSAHSFLEPERFWNYKSVEKYIRQLQAGKLPIAEKEKLSDMQMMMEAIYLGLRTIRGIDLDGFFQKFGLDFWKIFNDTIAELQNDDLIKLTPRHCALTRKGLPLLDSIASMFTSHLPLS